MADTMHTMQFGLREGKATGDWLKAHEQVALWSKRQPGFRFRSLSEGADGKWTLTVCWGSMALAEAAEERFRAEMFGLVEPFVDMGSFSSAYGKLHMVLQA